MREGPATRGRVAIGLAVGGILLLAVAAVAALTLRTTPYVPRFTEADLAPVPPPETNGWTLVVAGRARLAGTQHDDAVRSLTRRDAPDGSAGLQAHWSEVVLAREALHALLDGPARARVAVLEGALARPRFVDTCDPASLDCPTTEFFATHRLVEYAALEDALEGRFDAAVQRAARLLAADVDLARSGRTLVMDFIAQAALGRAIGLARLLVEALAQPDAPRIGLAPLLAPLEGFDPTALRLDRAVIGECLAVRAGLEDAMRHRAPSEALWLDRGATLRDLDAWYAAWREYVEDPATRAKPVREDPTAQPLWWVHNASGKQLLSIGLVPLDEYVQKYTDRNEALAQDLVALRAEASSVAP